MYKLCLRYIYKQVAFTLAELLIALTITGIVASLTIPVIAQKIQEAQLKIAWKENYSVIDKAIQKVRINYGSLKGISTVGEGSVDTQILTDLLAPHLNVIKKCDSGSARGICWHSDDVVKYPDGSYWNLSSALSGMILSNGAMFRTANHSASCKNTEGSIPNKCGAIYLDVNGFAGPNIVGKDIFIIVVFADGIKSQGVQNSGSEGQCGAGTNGTGCGAVYLMQ